MKTKKEITKYLGISKNTLWRYLKILKIKTSRHLLTPSRGD